MRYIRTIRNDYLVADLNELTVCEHLYGKPYKDKHGFLIYPQDIIKSADSIEELCDEFVGIDSQGHFIIHNDEFIKGARIVPLEEVNYYGAIWTNKGLIYVAKMNEKGMGLL